MSDFVSFSVKRPFNNEKINILWPKGMKNLIVDAIYEETIINNADGSKNVICNICTADGCKILVELADEALLKWRYKCE